MDHRHRAFYYPCIDIQGCCSLTYMRVHARCPTSTPWWDDLHLFRPVGELQIGVPLDRANRPPTRDAVQYIRTSKASNVASTPPSPRASLTRTSNTCRVPGILTNDGDGSLSRERPGPIHLYLSTHTRYVNQERIDVHSEVILS